MIELMRARAVPLQALVLEVKTTVAAGFLPILLLENENANEIGVAIPRLVAANSVDGIQGRTGNLNGDLLGMLAILATIAIHVLSVIIATWMRLVALLITTDVLETFPTAISESAIEIAGNLEMLVTLIGTSNAEAALKGLVIGIGTVRGLTVSRGTGTGIVTGILGIVNPSGNMDLRVRKVRGTLMKRICPRMKGTEVSAVAVITSVHDLLRSAAPQISRWVRGGRLMQQQ
jgi:hypothetical protein